MLEAADVSFAYNGLAVLRDVSVHVPSQAIVGILGPNGSGKTTLLRLLAGTLAPGAGSVRLAGAEVRHIPRRELARRIAVVPQETHLAFDFTVLEVVLMGRYPHLSAFQVEGPADVTIARDALAATGTAALEGRSFASLSGGEKQRVIIASALAQLRTSPNVAFDEFRVLLLDEPTTSLDLAYQLEIASILRRLHDSGPLAIVITTHDLNFAASVADSIVLLRDGRVHASGPMLDVLTADAVETVFGVRADVRFHDRAGHLNVIPLARVQ
ncbi:MAG: ABC transporter ATP-binding protein [Acidobacteria bacterium]|nr:ABC transporter ATP-binding protein [Acidobacteriota bacterium]